MPVDTALLEALLAPDARRQPRGRDLRYDPRYDQVKEARREDLDLPPGGLATERKVADWPQVVKLSGQLLANETKDLQLGGVAYGSAAEARGLAGTGDRARIGARGILDRYWERCYPEWDEDDPELRAGPLEWVGSRARRSR